MGIEPMLRCLIETVLYEFISLALRPTLATLLIFLVRLAGFEPALTPLRYYALEERSGTVAFKKYSTTSCLDLCSRDIKLNLYYIRGLYEIWTIEHFLNSSDFTSQSQGSLASYSWQ